MSAYEHEWERRIDVALNLTIDQMSRSVIITESDGLEMTMAEKSRSEAINNGLLLFSFGNNSDQKTDR